MILAPADDVEERWEVCAQNPKSLSSEVPYYSIDVSKELLKRMCELRQSWSECVKNRLFWRFVLWPRWRPKCNFEPRSWVIFLTFGAAAQKKYTSGQYVVRSTFPYGENRRWKNLKIEDVDKDDFGSCGWRRIEMRGSRPKPQEFIIWSVFL